MDTCGFDWDGTIEEQIELANDQVLCLGHLQFEILVRDPWWAFKKAFRNIILKSRGKCDLELKIESLPYVNGI